ncbi:MAG: MopE-related protein [Pseudomonadota bacterium]|nr:MopE-related protein [Pseudomonadota bacterium]
MYALTPASLLLILAGGCRPEMFATTPPEGAAPRNNRLDAESVPLRAGEQGFEVDDRMMGSRASFSPAGMSLDLGGELVQLSFSSWGREGQARAGSRGAPALGDCAPDAVGSPATCAPRLEYDRGDGLLEWWAPRPGALQVGWDLATAPDGAGPIALDLDVIGARVRAADDTESLEFVTDSRTLTFGGLAAWDDEGRTLDAWMEPTANGLRVWVDDTGAVWPIHVDPTVYSYSWRIQGTTADYYLGRSFASGDFDNDGYSDMAVGESRRASVYVFDGSSSGLSAAVSTTLTETISGFGQSMVTGDVNEDGYDDILVGAPGSAFYIYRGSGSGLSTAYNQRVTLGGAESFGYSVALADFNGDGNLDVLTTSGYAGGTIYEYDGNGSTVVTTASSSFASTAVDYVRTGDFNGDGYADAAVVDGNFGGGWGQVRVYLGSSAGLSSTVVTTIYGTSGYSGDGIAADLGPIGDYDDDGYDDLLVGDSGYNYGDGIVSLYEGSATGLPSTATATFESSSADFFGYSASYVGDVNSDGYDDAILGSSISAGRFGQVELHLGSASGLSSAVTGTFTGAAIYDYVGSVAGPAGDVNGDGADDMYIGAWQARVDYASNAGGAYVVHGASVADADGDGYVAGSAATEDCDDTNAAVHPGATEIVADGIDQDCDDAETCYDDDDNDGYLDSSNDTRASADADCSDAYEGLAADPRTDCSDTVATIHPGATEAVGDGIDQDCDGYDACYDDDDNDGYLDATGDTRASSDSDCNDAYEGLSTDPTTDCDDSSATIRPGVTEITGDGIDSDCNGAETCFHDDDDDGFLDSTGDTVSSADTDCADVGEGTLGDPTTDCDDRDATVLPGATEVAGDDVDQDCDGAELCYDDDDNDGYLDTTGDLRSSSDTDCSDVYEGRGADPTTDCDDTSATTHPGAAEVVGDQVDQDCDGGELCYEDDDDDGILDSTRDTRASTDTDCRDANEATSTAPTTDCDDTDATRHPDATEIVGDGVDQDCDGAETCYDDDDDDGTLDSSGDTRASVDTDCGDRAEGTIDDATNDCDDSDASVLVGAPEVAVDGIDQDCDGVDACYLDIDGDGFGDTTVVDGTDLACGGPGESRVNTDCDPASASTWPGAEELPADGLDQDCDGLELCYVDADGDGHGVAEGRLDPSLDCASEGVAPVGDDCDDEDEDVFPGASEVPVDGVDQDCDGGETCYADTDEDGFGGADAYVSADLACSDAGSAVSDSDCDDAEASVFPGADESCNSVDDDCDGRIDEGVPECDTNPDRSRSLCGCHSTGVAGTLAPFLALGLLALRRRRA